MSECDNAEMMGTLATLDHTPSCAAVAIDAGTEVACDTLRASDCTNGEPCTVRCKTPVAASS